LLANEPVLSPNTLKLPILSQTDDSHGKKPMELTGQKQADVQTAAWSTTGKGTLVAIRR
jgi:hypothetical protein